MRISDWSSDVCSSDLGKAVGRDQECGLGGRRAEVRRAAAGEVEESTRVAGDHAAVCSLFSVTASAASTRDQSAPGRCAPSLSTWRNARPPRSPWNRPSRWRSEEHTSELQSLMRISYAVFCLTKTNN